MPRTNEGLTPKVSELIALCDTDGVIRFVSRSFATFFGAPAQNWLGQSFSPGGNAATRGLPARYRTTARSGARDYIIDWTETVLEGGERLYVGGPESADNDLSTDSFSENSADLAVDPKMRLLATMSHEMRTPLNGILGMTSLLLETALEPNQRAYAQSVRESGAALLSLINDLLDYSKIEAGKLTLEQTTFDPTSLVQGVAELLSPKAADKGVEIAAYVDGAVPDQLYGDEGRLRQVLINLAGNGVKFTDAGGVSIEAHAAESEDGSARVAFTVRDTGIGIPKDIQSSIFEEFAQGRLDAGRKREGTGLGLAIARKIVRAMGGDIAIESTPGTGSVFSFEVSLGCSADDAPDTAPYQTPVIVAADNPVLSRSLKLQLQAVGATDIISAASVDETRQAIDNAPGATLLCDVHLAGESPASLTNGAARSFVLISPLGRTKLDAMREAGFDGYFIKPIRQSSLRQQLTADRKPAAAPAPQDSDAPAPEGKRYRVLLAEDNQINAVLASTIIKRAGHDVDIARNGAEALDAVTAKDYDIVLMDMLMPQMDGLEATRHIRKLDGKMRRAPVIALTANAMAADRRKCIAAGMDDFLSKPFEPEELTGMLEKWGELESQYSEAS